MIFWIWVGTILVALMLYCLQRYSRFSRYGVKGPTPIPLLGNMAPALLRLYHLTEGLEKTYKQFAGERFVGEFMFISPAVVLRDLELIKKITVKDFEHFLDHQQTINENIDPIMGKSLISLKGQEWKDMRSTLSPAFTSSKIRLMVPFMVEVGDQMLRTLKQKIQDSGADHIDVEAKDLTTRYANDVIASCAFGLKVDSQKEQDNQFYKMGKLATNFTFRKLFLFLVMLSLPSKLTKKLNIQFFSKEVTSFFKTLVLGTMNDREERHIVRPDMIHLLMEAKKGRLSHEEASIKDDDAGFATVEESGVGKKTINRVWSDEALIAQAVLFLFAGFDTVSTAMIFVLHELAVNPDVQEKLYQEIKENDIRNGGKFDFASIQQMRYMDMVVSETLRLWPPAIALERLCLKDYNLGKPNASATEDFIIRKDEAVSIPVWAIHHDPDYFPEPYKFDPERFSEQNKHNIKSFSYMPFGLGPRNCIGSRFALCEVKVMVYQLLLAMELAPGPKTKLPAKLDKNSLSLQFEGGNWIRIKNRR